MYCWSCDASTKTPYNLRNVYLPFLTEERLSFDQAELLLKSVTSTVAYYAPALHDVLVQQPEPANVLEQLCRSHEQAAVLLQ